jgi:hypothetical protein
MLDNYRESFAKQGLAPAQRSRSLMSSNMLLPTVRMIAISKMDLDKKNPRTRMDSRTFGLGDRSRTCDLLNPIQARYQTALHPDIRYTQSQSLPSLFCTR